ncbi:hypothetical protein LHYA1_G002679 [Lachnellula hyalina]|uniref:Neprosin PEP catalytic domain-containing protein n=1 Tax=Lachnellula hyalina TaxID=1316788 RepID=A0A8H8R646_9HELO|nr:uncharacterized protein LHYA1_G002679 [Lachnellula hyalina]TVY29144.1 hypothetical protein LHYA1_G002679 [Lachnellula hyalina]
MAGLLQKLSLAFLLATSVTSKPISSPKNPILAPRAGLDILKTTVTDTHTLDWIPIDSQGTIASAPPLPARRTNGSTPTVELMQPGAEVGPLGSVPIPRVNPKLQASTNRITKQLPATNHSAQKQEQKSKRQYSGNHWYVSSDQSVANIGGSAIFSIFAPYVQSSEDFSLLQTAVTRNNVPIPNNPSSSGSQTLEAGWINYPNQVSSPHLFTYFTTCAYQCSGDNKGGWNADQAGWIQVNNKYYPGTVFVPNSVDGGAQYEIQIEYQLYQGNWWLYVIDTWIGYYPASIFSAGEADASVTLAAGSDTIFYYGEVFNNENALTTTDMGSGEFAAAGAGKAAYMRNMVYQDAKSGFHDYTGGFWNSDIARYTNDAHLSSGTNWGSYVYLGGPGAGGIIRG